MKIGAKRHFVQEYVRFGRHSYGSDNINQQEYDLPDNDDIRGSSPQHWQASQALSALLNVL